MTLLITIILILLLFITKGIKGEEQTAKLMHICGAIVIVTAICEAFYIINSEFPYLPLIISIPLIVLCCIFLACRFFGWFRTLIIVRLLFFVCLIVTILFASFIFVGSLFIGANNYWDLITGVFLLFMLWEIIKMSKTILKSTSFFLSKRHSKRMILFLRSFAYDKSPDEANLYATISNDLSGEVEILRIGNPNSLMDLATGYYTYYLTTPKWQKQVSDLLNRTIFSVLVIDTTNGVLWEMYNHKNLWHKFIFYVSRDVDFKKIICKENFLQNGECILNDFIKAFPLQVNELPVFFFVVENIVLFSYDLGALFNWFALKNNIKTIMAKTECYQEQVKVYMDNQVLSLTDAIAKNSESKFFQTIKNVISSPDTYYLIDFDKYVKEHNLQSQYLSLYIIGEFKTYHEAYQAACRLDDRINPNDFWEKDYLYDFRIVKNLKEKT